jgi:carboxyl-terminal processing protease
MRPWLTLLTLASSVAFAAEPAGLREDAGGLERLVNHEYAYLDRLPGGRFTLTPKLRAEAEAVRTKPELIRFAERALMLLADHHAITGASLNDSWAVFPSYGDMWIGQHGQAYVIEQVREDSPAERAGIRDGDRLVALGGIPTAAAVASFWADLGATGSVGRNGYAARVLGAGRRDRSRSITVQRGSEPARSLELPNLYYLKLLDRPMLTATQDDGRLVIRFHDSLGDSATIAAFDRVMARAHRGQPVVLDLTDTPSGGNTSVARAIIGWFVTKPTAYQIHNLPVEERETGIARQWIEQVLPRSGKYHSGRVTVRVGRWTGSMGEGMAIGLWATDARVEGTRMAGLLGAIYDHPLTISGVVVKLPTERLYAVDGTARERFVPQSIGTVRR